MITVNLEVPPELQSKPRRFKHEVRIHHARPSSFSIKGKRPELVWQRIQMGTIAALIGAFSELLCEGSLSVDVRGGHSVVEGTVVAFSEESLILAEKIGVDIEAAAHNLASKSPTCRFSTAVRLECNITTVSQG